MASDGSAWHLPATAAQRSGLQHGPATRLPPPRTRKSAGRHATTKTAAAIQDRSWGCWRGQPGSPAISRATSGRGSARHGKVLLHPLTLICAVQTAGCLVLVRSNTAFTDEADYLRLGHLLIAHWLHGKSWPAGYADRVLSGAPAIYPPLGALADSVGRRGRRPDPVAGLHGRGDRPGLPDCVAAARPYRGDHRGGLVGAERAGAEAGLRHLRSDVGVSRRARGLARRGGRIRAQAPRRRAVLGCRARAWRRRRVLRDRNRSRCDRIRLSYLVAPVRHAAGRALDRRHDRDGGRRLHAGDHRLCVLAGHRVLHLQPQGERLPERSVILGRRRHVQRADHCPRADRRRRCDQGAEPAVPVPGHPPWR